MIKNGLPTWFTILFFLILRVVFAQSPAAPGKSFLPALMKAKMPQFGYVFMKPSAYRVQVIYTRVDRDENNKPRLKTYYYRNYPAEYISPASMVKLPLSILTLEQLNTMKASGVTRDTHFSTDCTFRCQTATRRDRFACDSIPTLSGCITAALVVSNNEAYNRLYEFLGQRAINHRLWDLGFANTRIIQRFNSCDTLGNRHTNGFFFYNDDGKLFYRQEARYNSEKYAKPIRNMRIGKGYLDQNNHILRHGMDFSNKNHFPLSQVDDVMKRVIFPELYPERKQFRISDGDLDFLRRLLALRPDETGITAFSVKEDYWDACTNYLFYGGEENETIPENIRVFNIVGQSYGFLSDCAYFVDFLHRIEFFLSATIYVNSDGILNDGKYEYKTIGLPFLKQLGQVICDYELQRKMKRKPDLSSLEKLFDP